MFFDKRWRYVRAMMKAIDKARTPVFICEKQESKTNGLRVIKRFERINGLKFDPFNKDHVGAVYGNASHESFFRKAGFILKGAVSE